MFRITAINTIRIGIALGDAVHLSSGTIAKSDSVLVRITDDRGRIGWGEASAAPAMTGETSPGMISAISFMAVRLQEQVIENTASIDTIIGQTIYGNPAAKSALSIALYDLAGKHLNLPIFDLLGGKKRDRATLIWRISGADKEIETAYQRRDEGFVSFKVKVATNPPDTDLERSYSARTAVGRDVTVSADANGGYSTEDGLYFARMAGDAGLDFLEQPLSGDNLAGMTNCANTATIPIGADEGLHGLDTITLHHKIGAASGGSLKPIKFGGLSQVMEAADLMGRLSMHVNLAGKAGDSSVSSAAIAHLALALPELNWHTNITNHYLIGDVASNPIKITHGHVLPPDGPGLGIDVDEDLISRYRAR
jgi:L-alanine-DL-glutamate epimerase-like enolase superfamily enzyme